MKQTSVHGDYLKKTLRDPYLSCKRMMTTNGIIYNEYEKFMLNEKLYVHFPHMNA